MKTKIADRDKVRTETVTITLSPAEKRELMESAHENGLTVCAFVRSIVKNYYKQKNQ